MKKPEILAPAGSLEALKASFKAGADAVYMGGTKYGARAYAKNFTDEELLYAIDHANLRGKKLYLTVNTLVKERELEDLREYLEPLYKEGLSGVIVQDMGVIKMISEEFPLMPVHISTQAGAATGIWAHVFKDTSVRRIVVPRELSLDEIRDLKADSGLEVEVFVQGAMCYCFSGQCLFSSILGGRSGNRGRCAQPCRLPVDVERDNRKINFSRERYALSLKDMNTLQILPDIIETGADSLKIEGRMKSPDYSAITSYMYRKYVDLYMERGRGGYMVEEKDMLLLRDFYGRGDFSQGYFKDDLGKDMLTLSSPAYNTDEKAGSKGYREKILKIITDNDDRIPLTCRVSIEKNKPVVMEIEGPHGLSFSFSQGMALKAEKRAVTADVVTDKMDKTGDSPFTFREFKAHVEEDVFVPLSDLKELRRNALKSLEDRILEYSKR